MATHYTCLMGRCREKGGKDCLGLASKVSITLLRYSDFVPADKCFYQARFGHVKASCCVCFPSYVQTQARVRMFFHKTTKHPGLEQHFSRACSGLLFAATSVVVQDGGSVYHTLDLNWYRQK